jgi:hypothetical protein
MHLQYHWIHWKIKGWSSRSLITSDFSSQNYNPIETNLVVSFLISQPRGKHDSTVPLRKGFTYQKNHASEVPDFYTEGTRFEFQFYGVYQSTAGNADFF